MKKYLLVAAVVAAMVLSMVGSALASFSDVASDADYAQAFDVFEELEVYNGYPDGTAKPNQEITRAEFSAVVVRMLNLESTAQAANSQETNFTDDDAIPDWARGYIIVASNLEIVQGYPGGSFQPDNNVTFAESLAMLARALEVDDAASDDWPTNYLTLGAEIGLTEGVSPDANEPITRGEMAIMSFNGVLSEWKLNASDELEETATPLLEQHWPDTYDEVMATDVTGTYEDYLTSSDRLQVDGELYEFVLDGGDFDGDVVVNDELVYHYDDDMDTPSNLVAAHLETDDQVILDLQNGDITRLEVISPTYENVELTGVDTDAGETMFGTIVVPGPDTLNVDSDTTVLLDGSSATLAELETAFDDFVSVYGVNPLVNVRTRGDVAGSGEDASWISALTDNTVTGEVTASGNDGDAFIRLDGDKVYYDSSLTVGPFGDFDVGDTVTLLLGSDDVAYQHLTVSQEDQYFAKVLEYTEDGTDLETLKVEKANGSQVVLDSFTCGLDLTAAAAALGSVKLIDISSAGAASFASTTLEGSGTYDDHSNSWIEADGTKYVLDSDIFVYDSDADEFIGLDDVETTDNVALYSIDGVVGCVVVDNTAPSVVAPAGDGIGGGEALMPGDSLNIEFSEDLANKDEINNIIDNAFTGTDIGVGADLTYYWDVPSHVLTVTNNTGGAANTAPGDITAQLEDNAGNTTAGAVIIDD